MELKCTIHRIGYDEMVYELLMLNYCIDALTVYLSAELCFTLMMKEHVDEP